MGGFSRIHAASVELLPFHNVKNHKEIGFLIVKKKKKQKCTRRRRRVLVQIYVTKLTVLSLRHFPRTQRSLAINMKINN